MLSVAMMSDVKLPSVVIASVVLLSVVAPPMAAQSCKKQLVIAIIKQTIRCTKKA